VPYVRTVKTASGATAVQIVYSSHRGSRDIEHIGSSHDDAELEPLKAGARQPLVAGQGELDLGLEATEPARRGAGRVRSARRGAVLAALNVGDEVMQRFGACADDKAGDQQVGPERRCPRAAGADGMHERDI
jgi:hypothetical protein